MNKNKYKNKNKNNYRRYYNNNRYRRKNKLNAVPYLIKSGPQRYGPGKNLCVINETYFMNTETTYRISLQSMLLSNSEFSTRKMFFRYFKVLEIRAVFLPSGINENEFHYLNFSWNSIEETFTDLYKDDSTKIVPLYRPRTRIVKWRPIRSTINVNSVSQEVPINFINMTEFISTDRVVSLPGWLYISNGKTSDPFIFETVIEFRGNDFGDAPKGAKLHEWETLIQKWKKEDKKIPLKITELQPVRKDEEKDAILEEEEEEEELKEEKDDKKKKKNKK